MGDLENHGPENDGLSSHVKGRLESMRVRHFHAIVFSWSVIFQVCHF